MKHMSYVMKMQIPGMICEITGKSLDELAEELWNSQYDASHRGFASCAYYMKRGCRAAKLVPSVHLLPRKLREWTDKKRRLPANEYPKNFRDIASKTGESVEKLLGLCCAGMSLFEIDRMIWTVVNFGFKQDYHYVISELKSRYSVEFF